MHNIKRYVTIPKLSVRVVNISFSSSPVFFNSIFLLMFTLKNNSIGKVGVLFQEAGRDISQAPVQAQDLANALKKYPGTKAYETLRDDKSVITDANIADKRLLLIAAQARIADKTAQNDQTSLDKLKVLTLNLQADIIQYDAKLIAGRTNDIKSSLAADENRLNVNISPLPVNEDGTLKQPVGDSNIRINFADPALNKLQDTQIAQIDAVNIGRDQAQNAIITETQPKITTESEYAGRKAYETLKSGDFNVITASNLGQAKKLLMASEARLKVITKENAGYENMQALTKKLAQNIQLFENISADMQANGLEPSASQNTDPVISIQIPAQPTSEVGVSSSDKQLPPRPTEIQTDSLIENIDGLKVDTLVGKIFDLPDNFFKGEVTRVSKFQELMKVTAHLLQTGAEVPKTPNDWKALGYSGQGRFSMFGGDRKELAVLNNFLTTVRNDRNKASLVKEIVTASGNSEQ